jgi:hypothetical protein
MIESAPVAYLLDVDNTLIDSDGIVDDFRQHLATVFDDASQAHYWKIFECLQSELGYADYLGALQRYRCEKPRDLNFLKLSLFLLDYPFAARVLPKALDVVYFLRTKGPVAIVSNGDVVLQPRKIERSGLFEAVQGNVLVYIHKEHDLEDVERYVPAHRYVFLDDEPKELAAAKQRWRDRATTVFVRQGRHAHDSKHVRPYVTPDYTVDHISDVLHSDVH